MFTDLKLEIKICANILFWSEANVYYSPEKIWHVMSLQIGNEGILILLKQIGH